MRPGYASEGRDKVVGYSVALKPKAGRPVIWFGGGRLHRDLTLTRLVQDGVDLYEVQRLLGHESFETTQRYAHLAPGRFDAIRATWGERTETKS